MTADIHKCQLPLPPPSSTSKKRKRSSHSTNNAVPVVVDNPGLEIKGLCVWLLCQSLAFIDIHATHVLESDEMEELDSSYVKILLKRDSLDVSEMAVFSAIIRYKLQTQKCYASFKMHSFLINAHLKFTFYFSVGQKQNVKGGTCHWSPSQNV